MSEQTYSVIRQKNENQFYKKIFEILYFETFYIVNTLFMATVLFGEGEL